MEMMQYKPLTSSSEILEEVKSILITEKNKEENCISLYDIASLMEKTYDDYAKIENSYKNRCARLLESRFGSLIHLLIDFDYYEKELIISFIYAKDIETITFSKMNGDLYISKSKSCFDKYVFDVLNVELSELYDELLSFSSQKTETSDKLSTVNSNFLVNISFDGVDIFNKSGDFKLLASNSYKNTYKCVCNSSVILSAFQGKEKEIFKKIFVKISECPEWSQSILYEIRQRQLAEEQRVIDEQRYREMKKQKRLELKRKIFPFLKK